MRHGAAMPRTVSCAVIPASVSQTPYDPDFSIQPIGKLCLVSECVFLRSRAVLQVVGEFLHCLPQCVGNTDAVAPAVIGIGGSFALILSRLISIGTDLFQQLVIPVIDVARYRPCTIYTVGYPVFQVIPGTALQALPVCPQDGSLKDVSCLVIGIPGPPVNPVLFVKNPFFRKAVVRVITPADFKAFRRNYLRQVAVRVIAVLCDGRAYRAVALDFFGLLDTPAVFVVGIMDDAADSSAMTRSSSVTFPRQS